MSKQSVSVIIDSWETHGLQNLHEINLDKIYAFPIARANKPLNFFAVSSLTAGKENGAIIR